MHLGFALAWDSDSRVTSAQMLERSLVFHRSLLSVGSRPSHQQVPSSAGAHAGSQQIVPRQAPCPDNFIVGEQQMQQIAGSLWV